MKKLQRLGAATTLLFAVSLSVTAGEIHTNAVPPPPPPSQSQTTAPGEIHTGEATTALEQDLISEIALYLLQLLPVF
jgi:hypothetical protein